MSKAEREKGEKFDRINLIKNYAKLVEQKFYDSKKDEIKFLSSVNFVQ
jgi:hypothetical protein